MRGLAAQELLEIWDQGQSLSSCGRAMLLLASACQEYPRQQMNSLSIGERDALLAQVRARTFGWDIASVVTCPVCREIVEVSMDVRSMFPDGTQVEPSEGTSREPLVIEAGDFVVHAALPAVRDVAVIVTTDTPAEGLRRLLRRCILRAEHRGEPCKVDDLPEEICAQIDSRMAEADPQGDVQVAIQCPGCEHRWSVLFDMLSFFWDEIQTSARRLLREVHVLASAYGWTESEILTLSVTRRRIYLEMVGG